jgi:hypothetical protein
MNLPMFGSCGIHILIEAYFQQQEQQIYHSFLLVLHHLADETFLLTNILSKKSDEQLFQKKYLLEKSLHGYFKILILLPDPRKSDISTTDKLQRACRCYIELLEVEKELDKRQLLYLDWKDIL